MLSNIDKQNFNIVKSIKKTNNTILKLESELTRKYGLTVSQYGVLECLYVKGDMCINELIKRQISTSGTMTVIVKNLEKYGYVEKVNGCEDKRFYKVVLTSSGKKLVEKMLPERTKIIDNFANNLNNEEKEELLNILNIFKKVYKEDKNE